MTAICWIVPSAGDQVGGVRGGRRRLRRFPSSELLEYEPGIDRAYIESYTSRPHDPFESSKSSEEEASTDDESQVSLPSGESKTIVVHL